MRLSIVFYLVKHYFSISSNLVIYFSTNHENLFSPTVTVEQVTVIDTVDEETLIFLQVRNLFIQLYFVKTNNLNYFVYVRKIALLMQLHSR